MAAPLVSSQSSLASQLLQKTSIAICPLLLWERACPRWQRRWFQGRARWQASSYRKAASQSARSHCGSGLARDGSAAVFKAELAGKPAPTDKHRSLNHPLNPFLDCLTEVCDCSGHHVAANIENYSHSHLETRPVHPLATQKLGFFFSSHHRWLLQHIQRRLRNHADAEDTAADTFCQMLAARVDPDSIEQPRAYLSTIARRLIFDRHRRRKLETAYLDRLALLPEAVAPSPEEQLQLIEALVAIDRAIDGLPMIVKATFLYSQLDGLSYVAIAQKLGLSERTVSRYMKQALRQCYLSEAGL